MPAGKGQNLREAGDQKKGIKYVAQKIWKHLVIRGPKGGHFAGHRGRWHLGSKRLESSWGLFKKPGQSGRI